MSKKFAVGLLLSIFLLIVFGLGFWAAELKGKSNSLPTSGREEITRVLRVVDGDTIEIDGKRKVRLVGINTPESVDPRRPVQCFGKEAARKTKELAEGKIVRLEKDIEDTDKYGRLLRYVWLEDDRMLNLELVELGYAQVYTYPPNIKYKDLFLAAQKKAREGFRGLWSACLGEQSTKSKKFKKG